MKKIILASLVLMSTAVSAYEYEYSFESGVEKKHLMEVYLNDNCIDECAIVNEFATNHFVEADKVNMNILKFHHPMIDNKFWKSSYSSIFDMDRYQELLEMNHRDAELPQVYLNNTYLPLRALDIIDFQELNYDIVGNLKVEIKDNNIDVKFLPKKKVLLTDNLVDSVKGKKDYEIVDDNLSGKTTAYIVLRTPNNDRYVPKGNNESNVINDNFAVLGLDYADSKNLQWEFELPYIGHLDYEFLDLVVWIEDKNNDVIQTASHRIFREYFRK